MALDRVARLAERLGHPGRAGPWRSVAGSIKAEVMRGGWSDAKQAFVQRYDSKALDASNLVLPFIGFLEPKDPRVAANG